MKIAVIGPVKPFRGGISHSNTVLCRNLSKNHELRIFSFKRLFPSILYPGRFQVEKGQKPPKGLNVDFCIDSLNPFNWLSTAKKINKFNPDVTIFQWWTTFLAPCYSVIAGRISNSRIGAVCHNVLPHEERTIDKWLARAFLKKAGFLVTLSESEEKKALRFFPSKKVSMIKENFYRLKKAKKTAKGKARKKLGFKKPVILFFGFVRPYKGLSYLVKAMPEILKKRDLLLVTAGEFWEPKEKYTRLIEELGIEKNTRIFDEYIKNDKMVELFCAADLLVLPYTSSTNSGIIQFAYEYSLPVVTTKTGGNPDLVEDGKTGLLIEPRSSSAIAKAVNLFYEKKLAKKIAKEMNIAKKQFEWNKSKEKAVLGQS